MKELIELYEALEIANKELAISNSETEENYYLGRMSAFQDVIGDLKKLQSKRKPTAKQFLRDKYKLVDFHDLTLNGKPWVELMEEYAQSHAKPNHSGKTKEQVWEEVQSYHQIEGTIPEGSRVETAVYDAMERFTNQDGWVRVDKDNLPGEEVVVLRKSGKKHLGTFKMDKYMNVLCQIGVDIVIDVTHWMPLPPKPQT